MMGLIQISHSGDIFSAKRTLFQMNYSLFSFIIIISFIYLRILLLRFVIYCIVHHSWQYCLFANFFSSRTERLPDESYILRKNWEFRSCASGCNVLRGPPSWEKVFLFPTRLLSWINELTMPLQLLSFCAFFTWKKLK